MKLRGLKTKRGISLIVLVITIIVMIILAAAIILSLSSNGIINKANKAKVDSDTANLKEYINVLGSEWQMMSEEEKEKEGYTSKEAYIKEKVSEKGISLDGKYVTETGDIITDSIISYVEYLKTQKGTIEQWDDITVSAVLSGSSTNYTYTDKGFEFEYSGEKYVYIYAKDYISYGKTCELNNRIVYIFSNSSLYSSITSNLSTRKIIVEVPEGADAINVGSFQSAVYGMILPDSFTELSGGMFWGGTQNIKELKINGVLTNISGCGIGSSEAGFPDTCRIFYQDKEMTVSEFTKLFQ